MKNLLVLGSFLIIAGTVTSSPLIPHLPATLDDQKIETSKNIINQIFITINLNNTNNTVIPIKLDDLQNTVLKICDNENSTSASNQTERPPPKPSTPRPTTVIPTTTYYPTYSTTRGPTDYPTYSTTSRPTYYPTYSTTRGPTDYPTYPTTTPSGPTDY